LQAGRRQHKARGAVERSFMFAAVLVVLAPLGGCALNTGLTDNFAGRPTDEQAVAQVKRAENATEPSFSDRVSGLWRRVTGDADEAGMQTPAPAEKFEPATALALVNDYREANGLDPLALDPRLEQAARAHAEDLARNDRISHFGSDGSDPMERVERTGFSPEAASENVGTGQLTFGELFREWQQSPSHNRNLLMPDATSMGVAVVRKPDTQFKTFWSLVLGTPG